VLAIVRPQEYERLEDDCSGVMNFGAKTGRAGWFFQRFAKSPRARRQQAERMHSSPERHDLAVGRSEADFVESCDYRVDREGSEDRECRHDFRDKAKITLRVVASADPAAARESKRAFWREASRSERAMDKELRKARG